MATSLCTVIDKNLNTTTDDALYGPHGIKLHAYVCACTQMTDLLHCISILT